MDVSRGRVAFVAAEVADGSSPSSPRRPPNRGIYSDYGSAGEIRVVVDTTTAVAGGANRFVEFGVLSMAGDRIAFKAIDSRGREGIYVSVASGGLETVADTATPIPGGEGTFSSLGFSLFDGPSLSGESVAFLGVGGNGRSGIYMTLDDAMVKVIAAGDTVEGKTVTAVVMSPDALDEDRLAFQVFFANESQGIYVASRGDD